MSARTFLLAAGWALFSACSLWPGVSPQGAKRLSTDARLGFIVTESSTQIPAYIEANGSTGHLMVGVFQGAGIDTDLQPTTDALSFFEVDAVDGRAIPLPSAPLTPTDDFQFGTVIGERGLLYTSGKTGEAAFYDGTAWTKLPELPQLLRDRRTTVARSASEVVIRRDESVWILKAGSWTRVVSGTQVALGPWGATGLRVITGPASMCTLLLDVVTGSTTAPQCQSTRLAKLELDALNGTVDDFQVLERLDVSTGLVWHYSNGTWDSGVILPAARARATPKSDRLVISLPERNPAGILFSVGGLVALRGGAYERGLLDSYASALTCGCARSDDAACDCVRRELVSSLVVSGDSNEAWAFGISDADARRLLYVRRFALPDTSAFDPVTCEPGCTTRQVCLAQTLTSNACIENFTLAPMPMTSDLPVLTLSLKTPVDPTAVSLGVTLLDGGQDDAVTVLSPLPSLQLRTRPNESYRVTLSAGGHVPLSFDLTMPDKFMTAALGDVSLVRGTLLGDSSPDWPLGAVQSVTAVAPRGGGMAVPVTGNAGVEWRWVSASPDGGITATTLAPASAAPMRARVDPKGRYLFLSTDAGLAQFDLSTRQRLSELPGADWDTTHLRFASEADAFVVRRGAASPVQLPEVPGASEVISFSQTGLTRSWQVATPGTDADLSANGTALGRKEGPQYVLHFPAGSASNLGVLSRPLIAGGGTHVIDLVGAFPPYSLIDHQADGGVATLSPSATFVTVDVAHDVAWVERVGVQGSVRTPAADLLDGGIASTGFGVSRLGVLFTQPPNMSMQFNGLLGSTESLTGSFGFFERDTGEAVANPACAVGCEFVVLTPVPRRIKLGGGIVFGSTNHRVLVGGTRIDALDPATGTATRGLPFVPATGPTPTLDGRFTFAGDPRQDAFDMPCLLYAFPRFRYSVSPQGVVTRSNGPDALVCVF